MRIAQVAPIVERVPPKKYGGSERVIWVLTEELVRRGHDVTLFATGDSMTSAKLVSVYPRSLREARPKDLYGTNSWTLTNIGEAYARQSEFDIIHDHNGHISLPTANISQTPVVMTLHGPFTPENRHIFMHLTRPFLVTISKAQAIVPNLRYAGTVHNGLNLEEYPFSAEHDGYLLFVGRISMEKGVHHAVDVASYLNKRLILAAKVETTDRPYYHEYIEPYLSDQIQWIGEVDEKERNRLMSRAMCFLHPITWREPFGLTLIEAMACGCPVVAFDKGSIPEIVKNDISGYTVANVEEMIDAIDKVPSIDRKGCRDYALQNFNGRLMADRYEKLYEDILSGKFR